MITANKYIKTPKLGIKVYCKHNNRYALLGLLLLIYATSVFLWFYSDCWISNWLNLYWDGLQYKNINDGFFYLWIEPIGTSAIIAIFLSIMLMIIIDLIWELLRVMDWLFSLIKRLSGIQKKIKIFMVLTLFFLSFTCCKRYDRMAEEFTYIDAINRRKTLAPSFNDSIKAKQICELILHIKNNNNSSLNKDMPWDDIAKSMLTKPDSVVFNYDICPKCEFDRTQLYFQSPNWTWEKLCGKAGHMIICPICKTQDFNLEIEN